jgi:transcriptional regulator with XRE-family HTH domain
MTKIKNIVQPVTADEVAREFREQSPEHERLYREAEARANVTVQMKLLRAKAGLSQQELADRIGRKQPFIARLERGGFDQCEVSTLRTVMRALGFDFNFAAMIAPLPEPIFTGSSSCDALEMRFENDDAFEKTRSALGTVRWAAQEGDIELLSRAVEELKEPGAGAAA